MNSKLSPILKIVPPNTRWWKLRNGPNGTKFVTCKYHALVSLMVFVVLAMFIKNTMKFFLSSKPATGVPRIGPSVKMMLSKELLHLISIHS